MPQIAYEWHICEHHHHEDGLVSVVVRLTYAEAAALIAATTDSATTPSAADCRALARPIGLALQGAVADGRLVLPS